MNIFPDYQQFEKNYLAGKSQLIWTILPADLETPVLVTLKLQEEKYLGLFESVEGGKSRARYSFITLMPDLIWTCDKSQAKLNYPETGIEVILATKSEEILPSLRKLIKDCAIEIPAGLPPMASGLFGYMGYDMVRYMEKIPDKNPDTINIPEAIFIRPKLVIVFDSVKDEMIILTPVFKNEDSAGNVYAAAKNTIEQLLTRLDNYKVKKAEISVTNNVNISIKSNTSKDEYSAMVKKAKEYILAGDIFQVVLAQRFTIDFPQHPFSLYRKLRRLNPSPFSFYIRMDNFTLVGSSPEILVRLQKNIVTVRPIAGTRPRGKDESEDLSLEKDLLADEKELAEHLMLIDLGRNDVGRIAQIGSVKVTDMMTIERYSHVMHIVSNVDGKICDNLDAIDAVIAGFPVGTVSGAPKIRAMEIIDELESCRRSFYAGGVGYFSANGDVDMCIALRTGLVKDNKLYVQAGGGIVADSSAEYEFQESCNKAGALIKAAQLVLIGE